MRDAIREIVNKKTHWVFFLALTAFYLSFTPGTVKGMGYNLENIIAADQAITNLVNLVLQRPLAPGEWTRHGFLELLFVLPFVIASKLLFGDSLDWIGRVMVFQPILFTSLSLVVTFLWIRRLTGSLACSYSLSLTAGVATMLWPYAYIGLETTQSFFVILSAYLALATEKRLSLLRLMIFGFACGVAISVKLNGIFLAPAIIYLIYCYFSRGGMVLPGQWNVFRVLRIILVIATVASVYFANRHYSAKYWGGPGGGSTSYFLSLLADNPMRMAFQLLSYFGSVNKSLLLYAPVTALGLFTLPRAYRSDPRIVVFAVLTLAGMAGGFSLTHMWADETWGPRYLHAAILPLTICFASAKTDAGKTDSEFRWRSEAPLLAAAILGAVISFLGSFFYYGNLHSAAIKVSQPALESLQHDPRLNHIEFNARLLKIWVGNRFGMGDNPEYWPTHYNWWFQKPSDIAEEKSFDLRLLATPLPLVAKGWERSYSITLNQYRAARSLLFCSLILGLGLFVYLALLTKSRFDIIV
ncbi:MAG: hypothetical protein MOB07_00455 [Acidobacteria bacterium]|nr:hypothetical protein [Acidobacteriota bacterium]